MSALDQIASRTEHGVSLSKNEAKKLLAIARAACLAPIRLRGAADEIENLVSIETAVLDTQTDAQLTALRATADDIERSLAALEPK